MFSQLPSMRTEVTKEEEKMLKRLAKNSDLVKNFNEWKRSSIKLGSIWMVDRMKAEIKEGLDKFVIWQEEAKKAFLDIIWAKLFSNKPNKKWALWALLFMWPTWVWKTQLAEALAAVLLGDESRVTMIEWEMYQQEHYIARLIWSPPGYVWFWWCEPILSDNELFKHQKDAEKDHSIHPLIKKKKWFAIVIVDEFEKMCWDIRQSFLNMLSKWEVKMTTGKEDDRRIQYSKVTDLSNVIFIFTSNAWSVDVDNHLWFGDKSATHKKAHYNNAAKKTFSKEFLWRINRNRVIFDDLTSEDVRWIINTRITRIQEEIFEEKRNISIEFDKWLYEHLLKNWFNKETWARELVDSIEYDIVSCINTLYYEWGFDDVTRASKLIVKHTKNWVDLILKGTKELPWKSTREVQHKKTLARSKTLNIIKWWEVVFPLDNWSLLMSMDKLLVYIFNYMHLYLFRDNTSENYKEELAFMEKNLLDLGLPRNDLEILKTMAKNKFIEENYSVLNEFIWMELSSKKEKNVFHPYSWTVVKKIIERKIDELYVKEKIHDYDLLIEEVERIIKDFLKIDAFTHAQFKELMKLFHHHYLQVCPKKPQ